MPESVRYSEAKDSTKSTLRLAAYAAVALWRPETAAPFCDESRAVADASRGFAGDAASASGRVLAVCKDSQPGMVYLM